jgi:hypothetical protein
MRLGQFELFSAVDYEICIHNTFGSAEYYSSSFKFFMISL